MPRGTASFHTTGEKSGLAVTGRGYLELTGYADG